MKTETLRYPFHQDRWLSTLLIGGVFTVLSFFWLPSVVVFGYVTRTIRESVNGEPSPPRFDDWGSLILDGLRTWFVSLIYLLVPGIALIVTTAMWASAMHGGISLIILTTATVVSLVFEIVFAYIGVAAIVSLSVHGRLKAGFAVSELRSIALSWEFAVAWIKSLGVFIGVYLLVAIIALAIAIGILLIADLGGIVRLAYMLTISLIGGICWFYAVVVGARLWGRGSRKSNE